MKERLVRVLGPLLGVGLFSAAIWILHREIHQFHTGDVIRHLRAIPTPNLAHALLLTALSYLALTGYDSLACRYVKAPLGYPRIALTSFVAYVFSHNVGLRALRRQRGALPDLSSFGLKPGEIARIIAFNVVTFWLGFAAIGGRRARARAREAADRLARVAASRPIGIALLAALSAYLS